MKKFAVALLIFMVIASVASAQTISGTPESVSVSGHSNTTDAAGTEKIIVNEPSLVETLPQPYENICMELSNGKEWILKELSIAVAEKLKEPEPKILENLGAVADRQYAGNPLLGMSKFCKMLDCWESIDEQVKAAAAFAKGYKSCGVAVIPTDCIEGEPQTKAEMIMGKLAWFIPFRRGTNATVTILGKKECVAKVWKILGDSPVSKEWPGGFWEREIQIQGK